ncbi:MAG TPA: hypothetical protein VIR55_10540 [Ignavibacteria bacterium]|jgi:hypothetical protein
MNQKGNNGGSKLWIVLFAVALIEFLYIVFMQPKPIPCPIKIEGKVEDYLKNSASPILAALPNKVIVFPVDAQDNTGKVISKNGDYETTINISLPYYYDSKALETLKETVSLENVVYIPQKGKEAQKPTKSDEEIIQILNNSSEVENNLFSIDKGNIVANSNSNEILIPVKFKIYNTGLYKFKLNGKLERASLVNNSGEEKLKIANGYFDINNNEQLKSNILSNWNRFSQNFYIMVMDATKPEVPGVLAPKVEVHPK